MSVRDTDLSGPSETTDLLQLSAVQLLDVKYQNIQDLFARLSQIWTNCQGYGKTKATLFEFARQKAIAIRGEFTRIHQDVNALNLKVVPGERKSLSKTIAAFDNLVENIEVACAEAIDASSRAQPSNLAPSGSNNQTSSAVRLKPVEISNFTNEILDFPRYIRLFESIYHNHPTLTNTEKFYYLQQSLQGEALTLVNTFELSNQGYTDALKALRDRYQSPRILASAIMNELLSFNPAKRGTSDSLRHFLKIFQDHVSTLKSINGINDMSDFLLMTIASKSLDPLTRTLFESKMAEKSDLPSYNDLMKFVTQRVNTLEILSSDSAQETNSQNCRKSHNSAVLHVGNTTNSSVHHRTNVTSRVPTIFCIFCNANKGHKIGRCPNFAASSLQQRTKWVQETKKCNICLSSKHESSNCKSTNSCYYCKNKQHHSLLCPTRFSNSASSSIQSQQNGNASTSTSEPVMSCTQQENSVISKSLLSTFQATVHGANAKSNQVLRCILDTGSVKNLITKDAVRALGLTVYSDDCILTGVGGNQLCTLGCVDLTIQSLFNPKFQLKVNASVIPKITEPLLPVQFDRKTSEFLSSFTLADSELLNGKSNPVHILLSITNTMQIFSESQVPIPIDCGGHSTSTLFYVNTPMGQIVSGSNSTCLNPNELSNVSVCLSCHECYQSESNIREFFQNESVTENESPILNEDEIFAENHFIETHARASDGRFIVRLPFKPNFPELGANKSKALACFYSLEKKLKINQSFNLYQSALQDFFDKGQIIPSAQTNSYILNQHIVIKKSNNKAKIVFNPAVKAPNHSFNDCLLPGPKLQRDLNHVLLSARAKPVALACDIDNFYRSISLHPEDAEKLHIFARLDNNSQVSLNGNLTECSIQHLCYGLTSAPFIALRCIDQLCKEVEPPKHETRDNTGFDADIQMKASRILSLSRYIDDIFLSADTVFECNQLKHELTNILAKGKFNLSKFVTSHQEGMELKNHSDAIHFNATQATPILGCLWDPTNDIFKFEIGKFSGQITRRNCTSFLAKCFDSQGLISPVIFYLKRFVQSLWHEQANLGWDKPIPPDLANEWISFTDQIPLLSNISVQRYCTFPNAKQYLCVFSDASNAGYASCAYLVSTLNGHPNVSHLLYSKSKLAPIKSVRTIPQLELAGIELSAKLIKWFLSGDLPYKIEAIYGYSDSMVALAYLSIPVSKLRTYAANRASTIHNLTANTPVTWLYCPTKQNPADLPSRGCQPSTLLNNSLWFHGPDFLTLDFPPSSTNTEHIDENQSLPDLKQNCLLSASGLTTEPNLIYTVSQNFSSFTKLQKVISYVLRFIHNCRAPKSNRTTSTITYNEINSATNCIVKHVQEHLFPGLLTSLSKGQLCPANLASLSPFVDSTGLIRVGGRLQNTHLNYQAKHPLLLPKNCNLSVILCRYYHLLAAHAGSNLSVGLLRAKFWITSGKQLMRSIIHKCHTCAKWYPKKPAPIQGQLPSFRTEATFPFRNVVGLDCFGPYQYKISPRKNSASDKIWGLIFVCEATRASHIEILTSMSAKHFLAAVDRYTSRRGIPVTFRSDCGTNFTAGFKKLAELSKLLSENTDTIISSLASRSITFQHIPAYSPWLGSWEPMIKCCKRLLQHLLKEPMYFEEYATTFAKVESLLNSRPYLEPSQDPREGTDLLCPANFLVGGPFATAPSEILSENSCSIKCRWDRIKNLISVFWKRWHKEVLHNLLQIYKWKKGSDSIQLDQLVWIPDLKSVPGTWPMGKVTKLYPDNHGISRVVDIQTSSGTIRRSCRRLILVPT